MIRPAIAIGLLALGFQAAAAVAQTSYTPEEIANVRRNVGRYQWAREMRDEAAARADAYLREYSLDELWRLVVSQDVPRSFSVNQEQGSPITGQQIFKDYGNYPYEKDPNTPWKLIDPSSGYQFPTNDFEAYYKSGLDEHGYFQPELADRSLLINELYPEKGPKWGVDDGYGWVNDEGQRWTFIAYYNHWYNWSRGVYQIIETLRDAYLCTGDRQYARAGLVLLDRVADVYPELDVSRFKWEDGFRNSHGLQMQGKALGSIWESGKLRGMMRAYVAFYGAVDDPELLTFLNEKARQHRLGDKSTPEAIRGHIKQNIVKATLPAVRNVQVYGNFGMHESALALSAVVADEPGGYSRETLDFLFQAGELIGINDPRAENGKPRITGGNLMPRVIGRVDRDGHNYEASPHYNSIPIGGITDIAEMLADYQEDGGEQLLQNVKLKKMYSGRIPLILTSRYYPHIGDTDQTGNPGLPIRLQHMITAFKHWGEPIFAQAAYLLNGNSVEGIHGEPFDADPEQIARDIQRVIDQHGPLILPSTSLAGYGLAALRDAEAGPSFEAKHQRGLWMYYGRTITDHAHYHALDIGLVAHGLDLMPDLGYVERTAGWPKKHNWTKSTISHNTVLVNAQPQKKQWVSLPRHFEGVGPVQLIDVEAPKVYPQLQRYRRTTALIRVSEKNSYAVDFFWVEGGEDHLFSFHGGEGDVIAEGLELQSQSRGTYAGEEVPRPGYGENTEYNRSVRNGLNYLDRVERDRDVAERFSLDWQIKDTWGAIGEKGELTDVHLRLTMLGQFDEVALADGYPPAKPGNPERLRYALVRRQGEGLQSVFTSVIEPYQGQRFVKGIRAVPVEGGEHARAVQVELVDGRTHTIAVSLNPAQMVTVGDRFRFKGFFALVSQRDGQLLEAYLNDGGELDLLTGGSADPLIRQQAALTGRVVDFSRSLQWENHITVTLNDTAVGDLGMLVGRWIYIETDGERNGAYQIQRVRPGENGQYHLYIGDTTTIREFKDPESPEAGYRYNFHEGAAFRIPLSGWWTATR